MNACVVYFSRTGNTKKFAQAIADSSKASLYDLVSAESSVVEKCDLLVFGTPVEGASPPKEAMAYIENMATVTSKKAIVFSTYRLFGNERAMKTVEKALSDKGYETILKVSKKGMKPEQLKVDFSKELTEIKKALETLQ